MGNHFSLADCIAFLNNCSQIINLSFVDSKKRDRIISGFSSIYSTRPGTLSYMYNQPMDWSTIQSSVVLCSMDCHPPSNSDTCYIPVMNPRQAFALIVRNFESPLFENEISLTARIAENCKIGGNVSIGDNAIVGRCVSIGESSLIEGGTIIKDGVTIGSNCIIRSGAVIGADGFGYLKDPEGKFFKYTALGSVRIGDHVEVGSNTCIARGKLSDTVIHDYVKIGELSNISHDVCIGEHAMVCSHVYIGGNTTIDASAWIAPGAVIRENLRIGTNALIGLGAVAVKDSDPYDVAIGVPAKPVRRLQSEGGTFHGNRG